MEKTGKGYVPQITALTHERAFHPARAQDEQMTAPENGGWHVETHRFEPVQNYRRLNHYDYDDKRMLFLPLWRLFLDGFTAAVENGFVDHTNWKRAFRFREDWMALGIDLIDAGGEWLNERHRRALGATLGKPATGSDLEFATYPAVGIFLTRTIDWEAKSPGLRLV